MLSEACPTNAARKDEGEGSLARRYEMTPFAGVIIGMLISGLITLCVVAISRPRRMRVLSSAMEERK